MKVHQDGEPERISFLWTGWGTLAAVDLLSEHMRCIGETRFVLQGVVEIICGRKYTSKLRYKPVGKDGFEEIEDNFELILGTNVPWLATTGPHFEGVEIDS